MTRETTTAGPTPGPWVARSFHVETTAGAVVADAYAPYDSSQTQDDYYAERTANVRLIAAAPDTYAALRGLMLGRWGVRIDAEDPETAATLRAALSRAEGRGA